MILRPLREADFDAVNAMARQLHDMHVDWCPDIYRSAAEFYNEKGFSKFMNEKLLYVAEQDGEIAAYVRFELRRIDHRLLQPRTVLYVEELCVEERFRHQGLGKQLMLTLKQLAKDRGCTDIELSALPENTAAVSLYESLGFRVCHIDYQMKL